MQLAAIIIPIVIACAILIPAGVKIVREYERGVIFRLGRLVGAKGPGLFIIIPFVDRMVKVDLRVITMDVPHQEVITKDNVTVRVNAVVYFRVVDPESAVVKVLDHIRATSQISQTTLRNVLGQSELDELLTKREKLSKRIGEILDTYTDPWGIKVTTVAIKDVSIDETMLRAIAKQAEAEREKRSRIIIAEGEFIAAEKIVAAAKRYLENPYAIRLREFQTLTDIAREKNMVVVTTTGETVDVAKIASMVEALKKEKKGK